MLNQLAEIKNWSQQRQNESMHRQLILVDLSASDAYDCFSTMQINQANTLFVTNSDDFRTFRQGFNPTFLKPNLFRQYLGNSVDHLIYDATNGVDLTVLYAIAGLVKTPGILAIFFDSNIKCNFKNGSIKYSFGYSPARDLIKDLIVNYANKQTAMISYKKIYLPPLNLDTKKLVPNEDNYSPHIKNTAIFEINEHDYLSNDQVAIYNKILNYYNDSSHNTSKENTVFCILGERGRGKTTLLGFLLANLLSQTNSTKYEPKTVVTASHKNQTIVIQHTYEDLVDKHNDIETTPEFSSLFHAPDHIIEKNLQPDILLIDEIASLAPELVKTLIASSKYTIISGTTQGYEGSGKGFTNRLLPFLNKQHKLKSYILNKPFRWKVGDPVERFFDVLLCTNSIIHEESKSASLIQQKPDHLQSCKLINQTYRLLEVNSELLSANYRLYSQIVSLLLTAHYQTTPNDIVRIINSPDSKIFVTFCEQTHQLIGVMTIFEEGSEKLDDLSEAISLGRRRVQGHMSAQALAANICNSSLAKHTYWRVSRIAVNENYRRQNIATNMISGLVEYAVQKNIDAVTSSFGFTNELLSFWEKNTFKLVKIGKRIDTSSGTASVMVIKVINQELQHYILALQSQVSVDHFYFKKHSTKLNQLFSQIQFGNIVLAEKILIQHCQNQLKQALPHLSSQCMQFDSIKTVIFYLLCHTNLSQNDYAPLFEKLDKGGIHKSEKMVCQNQLLQLAKPLSTN